MEAAAVRAVGCKEARKVGAVAVAVSWVVEMGEEGRHPGALEVAALAVWAVWGAWAALV